MTDLAEWHVAHIRALRGGFPDERKMDEICPYAGHDRQPNQYTLQYFKEYEQEKHGRNSHENANVCRGLEISYEPDG